MRDFDSFHPRALMLYFLYVILIPMFVRDPILAGISAVTGMTYRIMKFGRPAARNVLYFLLLALLLTTINPLFSHNGVTPLFYLNGNAYTLEALLYGAAASMNFISLVIWCSVLSHVMTSDKLMCVFSVFSPKLSLILTMSLRAVPLFTAKLRETKENAEATGLYKSATATSRIRGNYAVFSAVVSWALENGLITAMSMEARGYFAGRRSSYSGFRFKTSDAVFLAFTSAAAAFEVFSAIAGHTGFEFYPSFAAPGGVLTVTAYICCAAMCAVPAAMETGGRIYWKRSLSRI